MLCALGLWLGCGQGEDLVGPAAGVLRVSTLSTGVDLDPDGYAIAVDQADAVPVGANTALELSGIATGQHAVTLTGVADNCSVAGDNPRTVTVFDHETSALDFRVSCRAPVSLGTLVVTTTTSGVPTASTGYELAVDPAPPVEAALNGAVAVDGLVEGEHLLRLIGVPPTCTVAGENPRSVIIPAADTARVLFAVTCWPLPAGRIAFEREDLSGFQVLVVRGDGTGLTNVSERYNELELPLGSIANPSWSPDGKRLAVWSLNGILLIDAEPDSDTPAPGPPIGDSHDFCPRWSPDGQTIAYLRQDGDASGSLVTADVVTRQPRTLFGSEGVLILGCPAWSPDGSRIAFATVDSTPLVGDVRIIDAGGGNPVRVLGGLPGRGVQDVTWSGDGTRLAFVADRSAASTAQDIYLLTLPSGSPVPITAGRLLDLHEPSFSPDGNRIVFRSDFRLFVMNVDGSGLTQLTTSPDEVFDSGPQWGPDP